MTLEECYRAIGGDLSEVTGRLSDAQFAERFLIRFTEDDSFDALRAAVRDGRRADAFRAAHTLKGLCQNLGLGKLLLSSAEITEALRPETAAISPDVPTLLEKTAKDYALTVGTIRAYRDEKQAVR